jgi:phosphoribosylamine--glycine ligase
VLPLLDGDLLQVLAAAATGDLGATTIGTAPGACVTVVLTAGDYPARGDRGSPIRGITAAEQTGALVFHAGTALRDGELVTNGGRILGITGVGSSHAEARAIAYTGVDAVSFPGMRCRGDIAADSAKGLDPASTA